MNQAIKNDLMQALACEIPQALHNALYDALYANLNREARNHLNNYPNANIRQSALPQAQYHTILQTFDSVFCHQPYYRLHATKPKGGQFATIELDNLILLPRRSAKKEAWQQANYLKVLAVHNRPLDRQSDLFPETLPASHKVLVIIDIAYEDHALVVNYLVPNSRLSDILIQANHMEVAEQFEKPLEADNYINPIIKLKKTLDEEERIAVNQR